MDSEIKFPLARRIDGNALLKFIASITLSLATMLGEDSDAPNAEVLHRCD
jgi:hypothetical protein